MEPVGTENLVQPMLDRNGPGSERPPTTNWRTEAGKPMDLGRVVRIDERNGDEALRLLHDAYHALGRGYHDDGQWYGPTYQAIADFLYPDVVDVPDLGRPSDGPNCPPAIDVAPDVWDRPDDGRDPWDSRDS